MEFNNKYMKHLLKIQTGANKRSYKYSHQNLARYCRGMWPPRDSASP